MGLDKEHGKAIIVYQVLTSSQIHKCEGKLYMRNEDGGFKLTLPLGVTPHDTPHDTPPMMKIR